jgi:hypothetical protein
LNLNQQMANSEDHRTIERIPFGRFGFHPQAPLFFATVSFFAFPLAIMKFPRIESTGELLAVCLAIAMWMVATLLGIKSIPDIRPDQEVAAIVRLRRVCVLQIMHLAVGAALLCLCSRLITK